MPVTIRGSIYFCGREVSAAELALVRQVVLDFPALSITQLAETVCELLEWQRPNGSLKTRECFAFLQELRDRGWLAQLPELQVTRPRGSSRAVPTRVTPPATATAPASTTPSLPVTGKLSEYRPLELGLIETRAERQSFQQYLQQHHYLGYQVPVGAQLRYFVRSRQGTVLACLLFTSAAWRLAPREEWIGWDEPARRARLSLVVNNSRFLILPEVRVPALASHLLSLCARQLPHDWEARYAVRPLLLETLVDPARFTGACYRAANWIEVGLTKGRGRMDRHTRIPGTPKRILLYPLTKHARRQLAAPVTSPAKGAENERPK